MQVLKRMQAVSNARRIDLSVTVKQRTSLTPQPENESLQLLTPVPEDKLMLWLKEFYGKPVDIESRTLLRHRDLSYVERLCVKDALPESIIYKLVLPPWDIEQDLHERILIPSISSSAQLFMSAHYGPLTALFLEDLGSASLLLDCSPEKAQRLGEELAKLHRAYCYRTDELMQTGVLRTLSPIDYEEFAERMSAKLVDWQLIESRQAAKVVRLAALLARTLAGEPTSLVHGDLYAENIILNNDRFFIIDWSWFTILGVPLMDLATLTMDHPKNQDFTRFRDDLIDSYCFESGRDSSDVRENLPFAETLSRLLFLHWLEERRSRKIFGTTVGPVDNLIPQVVDELVVRHP